MKERERDGRSQNGRRLSESCRNSDGQIMDRCRWPTFGPGFGLESFGVSSLLSVVFQ